MWPADVVACKWQSAEMDELLSSIVKGSWLPVNRHHLMSSTSLAEPDSVAQWANMLTEPQCSGPGWLARRRGFDSHPCRHVESGFLHAMRLNSRVRLCPLTNVTGHQTQIGGIWVWWEPLVWITDGKGQRSIGGPHFDTLPEKPAG